MTNTLRAATVLAALELTPGSAGDVTTLLRSPEHRDALLGSRAKNGDTAKSAGTDSDDEHASAIDPLAEYLTRAIDPGRIEHWNKVLETGALEHLYVPVIVGDPTYPHRLHDLWDAPPVLFRSCSAPSGHRQPQGQHEVPLDPQAPAVAVIGGRDAHATVLAAAHQIAESLVEQNIRVVSGLAEGVDTAAHRGALSAGGLTTAVLGTGIDHVYPRKNRDLAHAIRRNGVLVSQFPPPTPRTGTTFLLRNAVIAGLSDLSLIMDGRARSGSRHEVEQALRYGRRVLLWAPALARESWAVDLEFSGAATFVESVSDVATHLR